MNKYIFDYELLDSGEQKRLEKIGGIIVERPAPSAFWPKENKELWTNTQAKCQRINQQNKWTEESQFPNPWHLKFKNLTIELRPSSQHQVGIFPEQLNNWNWIEQKIQATDRPLNILNLFAYTGIASLVASSAAKNVSVCHVDGAKSAISWARKNAELSNLQDNPIRWICDDVTKFIKREIKRDRKYDGIILDPPAFGRGPGGQWKIEKDLPNLLYLLSQLISDKPLFIILSCHHSDWSPNDLLAMIQQYFSFGTTEETLELNIPSADGQEFPLSICARISSL